MNKFLRSAFIFLFSISINIAFCFSNTSIDSLQFLKNKFSDSVELKESHGSVFLSKEQAQNNISSLLIRLKPLEVSLIHEGFSEDKMSFYGILRIKSNEGNFRLFYYCERIKGEYLITKIRVNKS